MFLLESVSRIHVFVSKYSELRVSFLATYDTYDFLGIFNNFIFEPILAHHRWTTLQRCFAATWFLHSILTHIACLHFIEHLTGYWERSKHKWSLEVDKVSEKPNKIDGKTEKHALKLLRHWVKRKELLPCDPRWWVNDLRTGRNAFITMGVPTRNSNLSLKSIFIPGWSPRGNQRWAALFFHSLDVFQRWFREHDKHQRCSKLKKSALFQSWTALFQRETALNQRCSALIFFALKHWIFSADSALIYSESALIFTHVDETIKIW